MEKTVTININGIVFNIEEDAYAKLQKYFNSIKKHFNERDGQEILSDIESRFAEEFSAGLNKNKQVVTLADVEKTIKTMGTVEDIAGEEAEEKIHHKPTDKKLFRDTDNAYIAGVASGLAAYFGIDVTIIRLIFIVSLFFGGAGVVAYLVLWLAMPETKTTADKIEMRGGPVNISSLKEAAKEKFDSARNTLKSKSLARRLFALLEKTIKIFTRVFLTVIGISITIGAAVGIIAVITGFGALLFNTDSPYLDFNIHEILPGAAFYAAWVALGLVIAIPMLFLLILGVSLVRRKTSTNMVFGLSLLMVWVISLTITGAFAIKAAPKIEEKVNQYHNVSAR